jgi:predicted phage-related endonuclease
MPRVVRSATTSKKTFGDDSERTVTPKGASVQPLDEKDRKLAESFLEEDAKKKEQELEEVKEQKRARNQYVRKAKTILNQIDRGRVYRRIRKQNPELLEKYKRETEPIDKYKQVCTNFISNCLLFV